MKRAVAIGATLVGVAAFAYTLSAIGLTTIRQAILRVGWGFAALLVVSAVREVAKAAAWAQTITGAHRLSIVDAFRARIAGESLSALLPMGFVVGEPAKAEYLDDRMPFATAFNGLVLEFAFYGASLAAFAAAGLLLLLPNRAMLVALVAASPILLAAKPVRRALAPVRRFVIERPMRAATVSGLEVVYHALGFVETYLILRFLNPATATWTAAAGFELLNRGITLVFKMVPMRVGVDEAGAAFMATRLAIAPSTGVMLALVRKLRVLFWTALGLLAIAVRAIRRWTPTRTYAFTAIEKSA